MLTRTCWEPFSPSASRLNGREKVTGCPGKKKNKKKGKIQIESPGVLLHRIVPATKDQMASRPFVTGCQHCHPLAFIDSLVFIQSGNENMLRCEGARCEPCAPAHAVIGTVTQLLLIRSNQGFCRRIGQILLVADHSLRTMLVTCSHPLVAG